MIHDKMRQQRATATLATRRVEQNGYGNWKFKHCVS